MKAKARKQARTLHAAQCSVATLVMWMMAAYDARAGDILRGGASAGQSSSGKASADNAGLVPGADTARLNAQDALARTSQAIASVRALQAAARTAASNTPIKLGTKTLPTVPNGLATGGLKVATGATWTGAASPTQTTGQNGRSVVTIQQTKQEAVLTWQTFNVGKNTTLDFDQTRGGAARSQWLAVNFIKDPSGSPSQILGSIEGDGQVFVINPNGILFGGTAQINLHSLIASSLPLNDGLLARGILNNPDGAFLFSALPIDAGAKGTAAFTPETPTTADGKYGDVIVEPGAVLSSPTSSASVGGRITLIGPRVVNEGTISVPDGQAILAAGLQVGLAAHASTDPNVRGLDVFVGEVAYPKSTGADLPTGVVTNLGEIDAPRANVTMAGRAVNQLGGIASTTSVTLNGSVTLQALYDAQIFTPEPSQPAVFSQSKSGTVTLGAGSAIEIMPELSSTKTITGTTLPLRSQVTIEGRTIHVGENATVLAPNADVSLNAGDRLPLNGMFATVFSTGQIYLDAGALINVAGTTDVVVPIAQNILSIELRGSELADSPLQRTGPLRAVTLNLDLRQTGTYDGSNWVGTPLGDASGFVGLIERGVGELTTAGGTVTLSAGNAVVMQRGSKIDVSGGWVQFEGGTVATTRVVSGGQILDISQATPDRVYQGIYDGTFTSDHPKYGLSDTFLNPLALSATHYESGYVEGKNGGTISITAPAMALDGELLGQTVSGPRQRTLQTQATPSALTLSFEQADAKNPTYAIYSPTPPSVVFESGGASLAAVAAFSQSASGDAAALPLARLEHVLLSPDLFTTSGFGSIAVNDPDGDIEIPAQTKLRAPVGGRLTLRAANLNIEGSVSAPGGALDFSVYDFTPYLAHEFGSTQQTLQKIDPTRGQFTLAAGASLSVAGLVVDDRPSSVSQFSAPLVLDGGSVSVASFSGNFASGSAIDASGGVALSAAGKTTFGNGGTIALKVGQDPGFPSLIGGTLKLSSQLSAFSGAKAGTLTLTAPAIQIGGTATNPTALTLAPEFFSEGGFGNFNLTGLGAPLKKAGEFLPGILVAAGTIVQPVAQSLDALPFGSDGSVQLMHTTLPESQRTPVSISLAAPGVVGPQKELLSRGSVILESGSRIQTEARGTLAVSGEFVTIHGALIAPGGTITIKGESNSFNIESGTLHSITTVDLGADAVLSTAGTTLLTPNAFGFRTGSVLAGGKISVSGNIVAEAGAILDVSGATDLLDVPSAMATLSGVNGMSPITARSGVNAPLYATSYTSMRLDSDAGEIDLRGGDHLFSDATLRGFAGGSSALGGTLVVSSGNFFVNPDDRDPLDVTLLVKQGGSTLPAGLVKKNGLLVGLGVQGESGAFANGYGRVTADRFAAGGFDSLTLGGTVEFRGDVSINARRELTVADAGVILANGAVSLAAPHVTLGQPFLTPLAPEQQQPIFSKASTPFHFDPTFGTGSLTVSAKLIDIGNLSLQHIGSARFFSDGGDIRGDGTLDVAGEIEMRAAQIYPPTAVTFTIAVSDFVDAAGHAQRGSVIIENGGSAQLPLSAGGQLNIFASTIFQAGTLRAPLGGITLGWDGTGAGAIDPITGKTFAAAQIVTLAPGSIASVSAIDPLTGAGMLLPYGLNLNGVQWIDPTGRDITAGGVVQKTISIAGAEVRAMAGSQIDIRGGGDLYSFRWVPGVGGSRDVLASSTSFAIVPGYASDFAPYAPFSALPLAEGAALGTTVGYANSTLHVGDQIYLGASDGLPAGVYTLLPARYALLPGAHLVTPTSGTPFGTVEKPDGSTFVPGYRFNDLNSERTVRSTLSWFEVLDSTALRARSEYKDYSANSFLLERSVTLDTATPLLPTDAGHLTMLSLGGLTLAGDVSARGATAASHSGIVDIATLGKIVIASGGRDSSGDAVLDAAHLDSFGAESLLIGGVRDTTAKGATISVKTSSIVVDNAGSPLQGPDVTLVANDELRLAPGAQILQGGSIAGGKATTFFIGDATIAGSGDGTLLRVTSDANASTVRAGIGTIDAPTMSIGAGAMIAGASVTLDSTYRTSLDSNAIISGTAISLASGQISILLDRNWTPRTEGLVLAGSVLADVASAQRLSLLSYSSLDFYGSGNLSVQNALELHAAQIRGLGTNGGNVAISANSVLLDNAASATGEAPSTTLEGTLAVKAGTITVGTNRIAIDQFANVNFTAENSVVLSGIGGLDVQGNLTASTPLLTATQSATQSITAAGNLKIAANGTAASGSGGLGASVSIEGASVDVSSTILLPSGALTLHSTTCDLTVNGTLDVGGTEKIFYDAIRRTPGGQISLISDSGSVMLGAKSVVNVSAVADGGDAGSLAISAPNGDFTTAGKFSGQAGVGGIAGSFVLDALSLADFGALAKSLSTGGFTQSQSFRIRAGDVEIGGNVTAHNFQLSADAGSIMVSGQIDASGTRGGTIALAASGSVVLSDGALLTVAGNEFDAAGKGGAITIATRGSNGGIIDLQSGATIDLGVDAATAASARDGHFTGTLLLRAPQNAASSDVAIAPIASSIYDASSIVVEGFKTFDLTGSGGAITTAVQNAVLANGELFAGKAGETTAAFTAMHDRLIGENSAIDGVFSIRPGAEIVNTAGNLTLGTGGSTYSSDWNLAPFRFGPQSAPGLLTLRASGSIVLFNSISDGFTDGTFSAALLAPNSKLPLNAQSWSYNFTAGADFSAADVTRVAAIGALAENAGSLLLGKNGGLNLAPSPGLNATTAAAIGNNFQTIRTGSGDITINAARDVQLLNQFATIYTVGTLVADPTQLDCTGTFDVPVRFVNHLVDGVLGAPQEQPYYLAQYSLGGGNVIVNAGADIAHYTKNTAGQLVADSEREMPGNWLYRRGNIDPATGKFSVGLNGDIESTTWWVDFSNFFQSVGTLGGGNIALNAGRDISNVDAAAPTNGRMAAGVPDASTLVELGGGDVSIRAGRNLDAGVYYVERGHGTLNAGGEIITNGTRSPRAGIIRSADDFLDSHTWLPTTLYLGKGSFDVSARGDILLGPVANTFLMPSGISNAYYYKTYFSTYSTDSSVNVTSLGGDVTLRNAITLPGAADATPALLAWFQNELVIGNTASFYQPWLRLSDSSVTPFATVASLMPATLRATALAGDVNVIGTINLTPSPTGTAEIVAGGAINGINITGITSDAAGNSVVGWSASSINVSDANPASIPGIGAPLGYQALFGTAASSATTDQKFLASTDAYFSETGSTNSQLDQKQSLHAPGLLHANDADPVRIYSGSGDISGLTLYSPKAARVISGHDLTDIALYIQNTNAEDISVVTARRDIVAYNANSQLRTLANADGNLIGTLSGPLAGDIQISGPGTLEIFAGRNLDLGVGPVGDGIALGVVSIGNARNPYLPFDGAAIVGGAGIGPATALENSPLDFAQFATQILTPENRVRYASDIARLTGGATTLDALTPAQRGLAELELFYFALRDAGRDHADASSAGFGNYDGGFAAISALFGSHEYQGDISLTAREFKTQSGGNISLLAPGGRVVVGLDVAGTQALDQGILTESGGSIYIFADQDVSLGTSRIFTLRGGDEIIWSTHGDIAAGVASKTVQSAPPTRVLIDPASGDLKTDLAGLATGGGIGVLATVEGVPPGNVDLVAPNGAIDAGDAGIRSAGNLNIAATKVLNAANIQVSGTSVGTPAASAAPSINLGSIGAAASTAGAASSTATDAAKQATQQTVQTRSADEPPSIIDVEVVGYGGGEGG